MRITINLATRIYLDHRLLNRFGYCAITLLLALSGWNISRISSNMGEKSRLNAELTAIQNKLEPKPGGISETDVTRQKTRVRFYNEIIERKNTNWLNMLETFENNTPAGISLSLLAPEKNQGEWKLEGYAKTFAFVQQYLEKLEASKNFSNVLLLSHRNFISGDKAHGVQFTISCKVLF